MRRKYFLLKNFNLRFRSIKIKIFKFKVLCGDKFFKLNDVICKRTKNSKLLNTVL